MNRGKRSLTVTAQKKMKKEVHQAQKAYPAKKTDSDSDALTASEMRKKFPKKVVKKQKAPLASVTKKTAVKTVKKTKKVSKRTTPGSVVAKPSTPAYPKKEGGRWMKTLTKQTQAQKKVQQRRDTKKK